MAVDVYQGEHDDKSFNELVGSFRLERLDEDEYFDKLEDVLFYLEDA